MYIFTSFNLDYGLNLGEDIYCLKLHITVNYSTYYVEWNKTYTFFPVKINFPQNQ